MPGNSINDYLTQKIVLFDLDKESGLLLTMMILRLRKDIRKR